MIHREGDTAWVIFFPYLKLNSQTQRHLNLPRVAYCFVGCAPATQRSADVESAETQAKFLFVDVAPLETL